MVSWAEKSWSPAWYVSVATIVAAHFRERLFEFLAQADRIRRRLIVEDRRLLGLDLVVLAGELRSDPTLERIDEANAENLVAGLR